MYLHRTIRQSNNLIGIQPGMWIPSQGDSIPQQYLFNCYTKVCVFYLQEFGESKVRLQKMFTQPMMSKFKCICKGPSFSESENDRKLDTFYALRENDIIQYVYSKAENLFVVISRICLPAVLISSEFIFWSAEKDTSKSHLVISAFHGGLGIFEFSASKKANLIFSDKSNIVLNCFATDDSIIRLEGGGKIYKYNIRKSDNKVLLNSKDESLDISMTFVFNGCLGFCKKNKIIINNNTYTLSNNDEIVLDCSVVNESLVILLTDKGNLYKFNSSYDVSFIMNFENALKLFSLNKDLILVKSRSYFNIYNITNNVVSLKIQVNTGTMGLKYGANVSYVSPFFLSYSNNNLIVTKQGLSTATISSFMINEPILGLHYFEYEEHYFVAVSLQSSTRLLEVVGNKFQLSDSIKIKENSSTIGIGVLKTKCTQTIIQIVPDGIVIVSKDKKKEHLGQGQNPQIISFNSKQLVIYNSNRCVQLIQCSLSGAAPMDRIQFEITYNVTTLKLSRPDPNTGYSEYIAYGYSDLQQKTNFFLSLQKISNDQTARTVILNESMPCSISSIEFIDEITICIGLNNGAVVVGKIDKNHKRLVKVIVYQIGSGAVFLRRINYKNTNTLFAVNSRPFLIQLQNEIPEFHPLVMNSVSFVSSLPFENHIISASGQTISINIIADLVNDFSSTNFPLKSQIVCLCSIPKERFSIVGLTNCFYIFDPIKGSNSPADYFELIETFENEKIVYIDISRYVDKINSNIYYIVVVTHTENDVTKIRIYPFSITAFSSQFQLPIITTYNRYISTISSVVINNNIHIIGSCKNNLLDFKLSNKMLGVVTQINDVGIEIREIVYSGQIKNSTYFFVGDKSRSVKLIELNNDLKQFNIISEEGFPRSITTLSSFQGSLIAGGDTLGDIFILKDDHLNFQETVKFDKRIFSAKRRLRSVLNYHIGDIVTGICCSTNTLPIVTFDYIWYSTVSNGLGCFIYKNQSTPSSEHWNKDYTKYVKILQILDLEMSNLYYRLTACDNITFRNSHYPSTNVIDLDIVVLFSKISDENRKAISRRISEMIKFEITPLDLDFWIQRFVNYFSFWQCKIDK